MRSLLAALRFLTVFPIPGSCGSAEDDLARSVAWFPLVGLFLGALAAGLAMGLSLVAPPLVCAGTMVVVLVGFSGGLHLDGLSDTADGLLSSRPREQMLEIMKDSHVGAMGAMAIAGTLLVKFAAMASAPDGTLWLAALMMPLAGRCAIVVQLALLPYARAGGLAGIFYRHRPKLAAVWAAVLFAAVAWGVLGWRGVTAWAASLGAAVVFSFYVDRKIGGATGDTLGAVCEIVEVVPALVLVLGPTGQAR